MSITDSVTTLKGVGPKKAGLLHKLGIYTNEDLAYFFPREYENRSKQINIVDLRPGESSVFTGEVSSIRVNYYSRNRRRPVSLLISDETGSVEVVFFNATYLTKTMKVGHNFTFFGTPQMRGGRLQVLQPEFAKAGDMEDGILPKYPLVRGLSQGELRKLQRQVATYYSEAEDILSEEIRKRKNLCGLEFALNNIHFPTDSIRQKQAKYRLVFDELMILQTGLIAARRSMDNRDKGIVMCTDSCEDKYIESIPYKLTGAQNRCVKEICSDMESGKVMNRLVQGDVGSGKTVVAEIAMYKAVKNGYQATLMAPTEILAKQHYEGISANFSKFGIKTGFLSGSMKASDKRQILYDLKSGEIDILIGTHAVIQPEVEFNNLALVITDEQHRFGVKQRIALKEKANSPHILVMTATPIPRTLAVILYGDLDVSVIDELPPGRQKIITRATEQRKECYGYVRKQLEKGGQVYVVAPLIEDSDTIDVRSAESLADELSAMFGDYNVELLHGSMKQQEKDYIMDRFAKGEIHILVATVVIEVGINVPNATVMVVENAERFGLAQLHQLRGRVGRGDRQSYCFLVLGNKTELAEQRCEIMEASSDGFYIAEEDLKLRGPGEIFGTRQHGLPDLHIADLARHIKVLNDAKEQAMELLTDDPELVKPYNEPLRKRVEKLFGDDFSFDL